MKSWNVPFGLIVGLVGLVGLCVPLTALAHPGHGDTVVHAVLHMLQTNGIWLGVMILAALAMLGSLTLFAKRRLQARSVVRHDSR